MRYLQILLICAVTLGIASSATALDGAASGQCVGGTHEITVTGFYIEEIGGEPYDGEISGIVFLCEAIGVCEESFYYPETPLPFDPQPSPDGWPVYEASFSIVPPREGVAYRYTPYGVRPDGSLVLILHQCGADMRSYALVSCVDVPIARGTLVIDSSYGGINYFRIDNCASDCWIEGVWLNLDESLVEELSGQSWENLHGQTVDVFGIRTYCGMAGSEHHELTRIEFASGGGCGPVPVEKENWGGIKAMYR